MSRCASTIIARPPAPRGRPPRPAPRPNGLPTRRRRFLLLGRQTSPAENNLARIPVLGDNEVLHYEPEHHESVHFAPRARNRRVRPALQRPYEGAAGAPEGGHHRGGGPGRSQDRRPLPPPSARAMGGSAWPDRRPDGRVVPPLSMR